MAVEQWHRIKLKLKMEIFPRHWAYTMHHMGKAVCERSSKIGAAKKRQRIVNDTIGMG